MAEWSVLEWIAYATFWVAAIILAVDTGLKLSINLRSHFTDLLKNSYWGFAPLVLLTIGALAFVANEFHFVELVRGTPQWNITDRDEKALRDALFSSPKKINPVLISVVPAADSSAVTAGYRLMNIIGSVPGWGAALSLVDAEYMPTQTGLRISVMKGTDPNKNENAVILKTVFEVAGFHPSLGGDNMMTDPNAAKIVIGKSP